MVILQLGDESLANVWLHLMLSMLVRNTTIGLLGKCWALKAHCGDISWISLLEIPFRRSYLMSFCHLLWSLSWRERWRHNIP